MLDVYEKAAEIRWASSVELIFQCDPDDVGKPWKSNYDFHFPTEADRAHAVFIELRPDR